MSRLSDEIRDKLRSSRRLLFAFMRVSRERTEVEAIAHQLLRSGTSNAAHVREASRSRSDAELCSKLDGALQEADESMLWLELLRDGGGIDEMLQSLSCTAKQTRSLRFFVTMVSRIRKNKAK